MTNGQLNSLTLRYASSINLVAKTAPSASRMLGAGNVGGGVARILIEKREPSPASSAVPLSSPASSSETPTRRTPVRRFPD